MVPLLAPLLGSMAASLLPATFGTGIAAALGMSGAGAGLLAAAAPKAIGAGIGTLLAGGDLGEAALNAVGFGAAGAMGGAGAAGGGAAAAGGAPTSSLRPMMRPAGLGATAAPSTVPTGAANAAASTASAGPTQTAMDTMKLFRQAQGAMGGNQSAPTMAAPQPLQQRGSRATENPMLSSAPAPSAARDLSNIVVPTVGAPSAMPAAVGIGTLPFKGQQPMSNDMMMAGMSPSQRDMASQYLRNQGMVGFA